MDNLIIATAQAIGNFVQGGVLNVGGAILTVMLSLMAIEFRRLTRR